MTKYDTDYAFLLKDNDDVRLPTMSPDVNTAERRYQYRPQPASSAPFIFSNGHQAYFERHKIKERVADVLFAGATFAVREPIRRALLELDLPATIRIHPAIFIDATGNWHEDFWYVGFYGLLDCVDRKKSRYMPPDEPGDSLNVGHYVLDDEVLDKVPLQERLLFRMGGTDDGLVVCHRSLFKLFKDGVKLVPVSEY